LLKKHLVFFVVSRQQKKELFLPKKAKEREQKRTLASLIDLKVFAQQKKTNNLPLRTLCF